MHGMTSYFIRRIMLIPITFICITFLVYAVQRLTPGGPIERAKMQLQQAMMGEGGAVAAMRCIAIVANQSVKIGVRLFHGVPAVHENMTVGITDVAEHVVAGIDADSAAPNDIVPGKA